MIPTYNQLPTSILLNQISDSYEPDSDQLYFKWEPLNGEEASDNIGYIYNLQQMKYKNDNSNSSQIICETEVELYEDKNAVVQKQKILIVDDESFNRMAIKIILSIAGVKKTESLCETAMNGEEAVKMIKDDII